ncbi:MAG: hypothetical protein JW759_08225 [Candidatus Coatesbacteria bacterium]|nr:hypothetical protein [Candidatus Coatesbacteria bacterium]
MLTTDELNALLKDIESDRVEGTTSTDDTDKFSEAVCAFANDLPNHPQVQSRPESCSALRER